MLEAQGSALPPREPVELHVRRGAQVLGWTRGLSAQAVADSARALSYRPLRAEACHVLGWAHHWASPRMRQAFGPESVETIEALRALAQAEERGDAALTHYGPCPQGTGGGGARAGSAGVE